MQSNENKISESKWMKETWQRKRMSVRTYVRMMEIEMKGESIREEKLECLRNEIEKEEKVERDRKRADNELGMLDMTHSERWFEKLSLE